MRNDTRGIDRNERIADMQPRVLRPGFALLLLLLIAAFAACSSDGGALGDTTASGSDTGSGSGEADVTSTPADGTGGGTDGSSVLPDTYTPPNSDTYTPPNPDTDTPPNPDTYTPPLDAGDGGVVARDIPDNPPDVPIVDPTCSTTGFQVVREQSSVQGFGLEYVALNTADTPYDALRVQIYNDWGGPTEPGTYSLDGINYADCGLCLLVYSGCTAGGPCAKTFYAEAGSVEITAIGGVGSQFTAVLHDVVFDEVTIDPQSYVSTPVDGGETWCIDDFTYDQEVIDGSGADCDRPDIVCVGETVSDFSLQNCETEEMVSLYSLAEGKKALWLVLTAGWCPACHEWVPQVVSAYNANAAAGLEIMIIVGENNSGAQPTAAFCRSYAAQYSDDASNYYIDHDGEYSYATTFLNLWPYVDENGAFGLPWNALIDPATFEYVYGDGSGAGDLNAMLSGLLAK